MNLNFRRTALLVGICSAVSLTYTPQLFAASVDAIDAVQQAKKITGTVTDAMGPVIGANVLEKGTTNGHLVDIKKNVDTGNYPEVESLELYKREQRVDNPEEEQRVRSNIKVYSPYGGLLYNVKFKLVSNVETLEYSTGNSGKLMVDLLEDVIYMVTVENPNYAIRPDRS